MTHGILARLVLFGLLFFSIGVSRAQCQEQSVVVPEDVGLSSDRLARIHAMVQSHIDGGELAGAVTMIARQGKVAHFEAQGMANLEAKRPMRRDDLFRIASMTKMFTSVAAMILYEEGHYTLYDPVSKFIPAFESMQVAVPEEGDRASSGTFTTVPAQNPITIRDLLRHTAGFTYAGGAHVVDPLYREAGLRSWGKSLPAFVEQLADIPLAFEPGTAWEYSLATDVLGYLIEVVSGQPLDQFFEERIFQPLHMTDTGFVVPASALDRLVNVYAYDQGSLTLLESASDTPLRQPPPAFSGGGGWASLGSDGGLVSTAEEYMRLLQMLLDGGTFEGKRLLSRKTVELMMTDHLNGLPTWLGPGVGFGLGFAVLQDVGAYGALGSPGQVWWAGSDNTYFWIDPAEEMIGVLMTQMRPFGHLNLMDRFQQLAMQAIAD